MAVPIMEIIQIIVALVEIGLAIGGSAAQSGALDEAQLAAQKQQRQLEVDERNQRILDKRQSNRELSLGRRNIITQKKQQREEEKLINQEIADAERSLGAQGLEAASEQLEKPQDETFLLGQKTSSRRFL